MAYPVDSITDFVPVLVAARIRGFAFVCLTRSGIVTLWLIKSSRGGVLWHPGGFRIGSEWASGSAFGCKPLTLQIRLSAPLHFVHPSIRLSVPTRIREDCRKGRRQDIVAHGTVISLTCMLKLLQFPNHVLIENLRFVRSSRLMLHPFPICFAENPSTIMLGPGMFGLWWYPLPHV